MKKTSIFITACFISTWAYSASLVFQKGGKEIQKLDLSQLKAIAKDVSFKGYIPLYKKEKKYQVIPLLPILKRVYGENFLSQNAQSTVVFEALDGYKDRMSVQKFLNNQSFLAFKDLDVDCGWEKYTSKPAHLGPYFVVWKQGMQSDISWAYQLTQINLSQGDELLAIRPNETSKANIKNGHARFIKYCIKCHALSGHGGSLGPDLNDPVGVLTWNARENLINFIKDAKKYRKTPMPNFSFLTTQDIQEILDYLEYIDKKI